MPSACCLTNWLHRIVGDPWDGKTDHAANVLTECSMTADLGSVNPVHRPLGDWKWRFRLLA
jgi:hypothetical protein